MKRLVVLLGLAFCAAVTGGLPIACALAQAPSLGLAERRAIKSYQDKVFPGVLKEIQDAAKLPLTVEVAWDKIAVPGQAADYEKPGFWSDIYFKPLTEALKSITADDLGKEALAAKLKKVVITYDDATAPASNYPNGLSFADGVFTINFRPNSNAQDVTPRIEAIQKALEKNL